MIKEQPIHNAIDESDLAKAGDAVVARKKAQALWVAGQNHEKKTFDGAEPLETQMLRDALGHHITNYKRAMESGNTDLINKHGKKIFQYMALAKDLHGVDSSLVNLEEPEDITKWMDQHPDVSKIPYKGWTKNQQGKIDYSFMATPPHPKHAKELHLKEDKNISGYPLEKIKINGLHVPIHDDMGEGDHIFDKHFMMSGGEEPHTKLENHSTKMLTQDHANEVMRIASHSLPRHNTLPANPVFHPDKYGHLSQDGEHVNVPVKPPKVD
jgi:hypothetical protein